MTVFTLKQGGVNPASLERLLENTPWIGSLLGISVIYTKGGKKKEMKNMHFSLSLMNN